ncbi:Protein DA1-related 5, partial [Mucuna pruriens]
MGLFAEAALGAVLQEGLGQAIALASRSSKFISTRRSLGSALGREIPMAQEIARLNEELDLPEGESAWLLEDLDEDERILTAHSDIPYWRRCCWPWYQTKLQEAYEALFRSNINILIPTMARDVKMMMLEARRGVLGRPLKGLFKPPPKPDLVVGLGLDNPFSLFNELKNHLLQPAASVLLLTALSGSGKTTLATLLCSDDRVREKFGENILFLTLAKSPNLKTIVQSLFQHFGCELPDYNDDRHIIAHLKVLLKEIEKSPMMFVLDDVWHGSESLIDAFKVLQVSDYKILVTSRFNISGFGPVYSMEPLCLDDSATLFRHLALPDDGGSSLSKDYEEKLHLTEQSEKIVSSAINC